MKTIAGQANTLEEVDAALTYYIKHLNELGRQMKKTYRGGTDTMSTEAMFCTMEMKTLANKRRLLAEILPDVPEFYYDPSDMYA